MTYGKVALTRRSNYWLLIAAAFAIALLWPFAVGSAVAQSSSATVVHIVAWGETLSAIAVRYGVTVEAIITANALAEADYIYAGQQLIIPGTGAVPQATAQTHIVRPGENLYRIGLLYGMSVDHLMAINNIQSADQIYVGQVLNLSAQGSDTPHAQLPPASDASSGSSSGTHVVQAGETLYSISRRYNVSVSTLATANGLLNPSTIYIGQQLAIPGAATANVPGYSPDEVAVTHIVQVGETLSSIAARYGVSLWVLAQINNIGNPSLIYVGQALTIPSGDALSRGDSSASVPGKSIVVDVSQQRAYVYQDGELLWTFVVSTGLPGSETWRGDFRVQNKIPVAYAATWGLQMPYWLGFYWAGPLQNGIHALPILSNGVRLWEGLLGQPASYGCVILSERDAELLYYWAEVGTPVRVQD